MRIFLTAVLLLITAFLLLSWKRHCPKCRRIFARKFVKKKIMGTKTQEEFGWNPQKGEDTTIKVKYKTVKYSFECKYCKHKWHTKKVLEDV